MGVGSFGSFKVGAAYVATRGIRGGGYGGGGSSDNNDDNGKDSKSDDKKNNWLWFSFNSLLIGFVIFFFTFIKTDFANYTRTGTLISKYQTTHKHKSHYYTTSYFTVKWQDRDKEIEMFEVADNTYSISKLSESVYFKRLKPEYDWMDKGSGMALITIIFILWIVSVFLAVFKRK